MAFLIQAGFLGGPKQGEFLASSLGSLAPDRSRGLVNTREPCADLSLFKKRMLKHQHQTKGTLKALSALERVWLGVLLEGDGVFL